MKKLILLSTLFAIFFLFTDGFSQSKWQLHKLDSTVTAKVNANAHQDTALNNLKISKSDSNTYRPCYVYAAKMTQTSTSNPTVTVIYNTLSANITCTRSATGIYQIINTDSTFTADKVFITAYNANGTQDSIYVNRWVKVTHTNTAVITISTFIKNAAADAVLTEFYIKLEKYK